MPDRPIHCAHDWGVAMEEGSLALSMRCPRCGETREPDGRELCELVDPPPRPAHRQPALEDW